MGATNAAIRLVCRLKATPSQAYAAWTDRELFAKWMSSPDFKAIVVEFDARVGGRYRFDVTGPEGEVHSTAGKYQVLEPGVRLAMTWVYSGPHPAADRSESLVTVDFHEIQPGITLMTLRHEHIGTEEGAGTLRLGWTSCFDQLEELFGGSAEWSVEISKEIAAPASKVFEAWIDPAMLEQWLTSHAEADPRVGGRYRLEFRDEANPGVVQVCAGEYLELDPDHRLVKSWTYESGDPEQRIETVVEVELVEKSTGFVDMTVIERGHVAFNSQETEETRQAWNEAVDVLARLLSEG